MKKNILYLFVSALLVTILVACSTSNSVTSNRLIQKRKFNKGWHINSNKKQKTADADLELEVLKAENIRHNKSNTNNQSSAEQLENVTTLAHIIVDPTNDILVEDMLTNEQKAEQLQKQIEQPVQLEEDTITKAFLEANEREEFTNNDKNSRRKQNLLSVLFFAIALTVPLALLSPKVRSLSRWAEENPRKTKILIAVIQTAALIIAALIGSLIGFTISPWMIVFGVIGLAIAIVMYLQARQQGLSGYKLRTNAFGLGAVSGGFSMFIAGANGLFQDPSMLLKPLQVSSQYDPSASNLSMGATIGLMVFLIIMYILIIIACAILSCYMVCSGENAAAIAIGVGGVGLATLGFVLIWLRLFSRYNYLKKNDLK